MRRSTVPGTDRPDINRTAIDFEYSSASFIVCHSYSPWQRPVFLSTAQYFSRKPRNPIKIIMGNREKTMFFSVDMWGLNRTMKTASGRASVFLMILTCRKTSNSLPSSIMRRLPLLLGTNLTLPVRKRKRVFMNPMKGFVPKAVLYNENTTTKAAVQGRTPRTNAFGKLSLPKAGMGYYETRLAEISRDPP
jgi:hypothetical protein